jgi:hypothetical protein
MGIVSFSKNIEQRPILDQAGQYGQGLQHEADVELARFECPAEDRLPAFDRDNERGPYAYFGITVTRPDGTKVFYDHWEEVGEGTGSRLREHLANAGAPISEGEDDFNFDPADVAPRKLGGIEVKDPRSNKEGTRLFSGGLVRIIGA